MTDRPVVLDELADADRLAELRADERIEFLDHRDTLDAELAELLPAPGPELTAERHCWVHYPWRRTVVGLLGPRGYRRLRLDRNRNKITLAEQERFAARKVGVVGLSVGHAIAHTIALEGLCGELRLADFDEISLSNLNRIPVSVFDIAQNKAIVASRRIAEIDPYLCVRVYPSGIDDETLASFLDGLDLVVEECDSLDVKFAVREAARARGIPVLMQTSDRGLLDIERFDLDAGLPLLHGLAGDIDRAALATLSPQERIDFVIRLLGGEDASPGLLESMRDIGDTLATWPQLGSDVALGGALIAAALRHFGTGRELPSGRLHVDMNELLRTAAAPIRQQ